MSSRHASIVCEFCQTEMRKNLLAPHVKAKHAKEVAQLMLEQWKESATCNMIQLMTQFAPAKRTWIHSKMYPGCFYLFGIKPTFFTDDDDHSSYIECEANMSAHEQFLEEIAREITLYDLIQIGKPIVFTCPEVVSLHKTVRRLTSQVEEEKAKYHEHVSRLETEASTLREILHFSEDEYVIPYRDLEKHNAFMKTKMADNQLACDTIKKEYAVLTQTLKEEFGVKANNLSDEMIALYDSLGKARDANDQLQSKFKRAVADAVEKERQKEKAEKEKKKEKKEKEKVKKALEKKKADRKVKKAIALAKLETDSDSDSDSDSDDD